MGDYIPSCLLYTSKLKAFPLSTPQTAPIAVGAKHGRTQVCLNTAKITAPMWIKAL